MRNFQNISNIKPGETIKVSHVEVGALTLTADVNKNDGTVCVLIKDSKENFIGYMKPTTFLKIYEYGLY